MTTRPIRLFLLAMMLPLVLIGCDTRSEWPEPGEQLPGWVYDAPYYYEPQLDEEVRAADTGIEGHIPHFYSRELVVPLRRPDASPPSLTPRLAVYYSEDHCITWRKAGYYGIDQAFFSFVAPRPGTYAIRFAGPGVPPLRVYPHIPPHRVLHIDRTAPSVVVQVSPIRDCYQPGDAINLSWTVADAHIDPNATVTIYEVASPTTIRVIGEGFPLSANMGIIVPPSVAEHGVRFAVEAKDKAGNTGRGFSFLLLSAAPALPGDQTHTEPIITPTSEAPTIVVPAVSPSGPADAAVRQPAPPASDRLPVVRPPNLPLNPDQQSLPTTTHPADESVDPSYRPRFYPTTQGD